jgi:two-component system OmpR family sensor kinase/two-component system sensor histidine kinase BaeS
MESDAQSLSSDQRKLFATLFERLLLISSAIAILVALLTGIILARIFLAPIRSLTTASDAIAQGRLLQNIPIISNDEIGKLTHTFNEMSNDLVISDQQRRQLTADIAHDLGTPSQIISGYLEMALDGSLPLTDDKIKIIYSEMEHIKYLLKDLNLLAETDTKTLSLEIEPVQIATLFQRVQAIYSSPCKRKNINLYVDVIGNIPKLNLDEERMVQIFANLISNSMRYTPKYGVIKLEAQPLGNKLIITVEDSGSGIAEKKLPFIFDRFYRGESARGNNPDNSSNSGLGLTISKALIEMQGGSIHASSDGENKGCTFFITFPLNSIPQFLEG